MRKSILLSMVLSLIAVGVLQVQGCGRTGFGVVETRTDSKLAVALIEGAVCSQNQTCASGICIGRTCAVPAGITEVCDAGDDADCSGTARCIEGTCRRSMGDTCDSNLQCAETCISLTCAPQASLMQGCDDGDNADCTPDALCAGGTCLLKENAICASNESCDGTCVGLRCTMPSNAGEACDSGDDADCTGDLVCSGGLCAAFVSGTCRLNVDCPETCVSGSCGPWASANQVCDSGDSADCASGLQCIDGLCKGIVGSDCASNNVCADTCIAGKCADFSVRYGRCDSADDGDCLGSLLCSARSCLEPQDAPCADNGVCAETCIQTTCSAVSNALGACDFLDDMDCASNMTCVETTCYALKGTSCAQNVECLDTCISGVCAGHSGLGGPCDDIPATAGDSDCVPLTVCVSGVCRSVDGEMCDQNIDCQGTCIDLVCNRRGSLGICDPGDDYDCGDGSSCLADGICS